MPDFIGLLLPIVALLIMMHLLNRYIPVYTVLRGIGAFLFPAIKHLFDLGKKPQGARFQGRFEILKFLKSSNKGLSIDGKEKRLSPEDSFKHCLLVAPTGAGKTTKYVANNLLLLDDCSLVITDPSGELFELVSDDLYRRGYHIKVINTTDSFKSMQ